jgi:cobalt-zinc-cadmium efflux system outer membrane protein
LSRLSLAIPVMAELAGIAPYQQVLTWVIFAPRMSFERNEKLMEAARAQVLSDVDSAYATVTSNIALLQPYKDRYLKQVSRVRDTIAFSYEHGAASLLDFLNAQADYRSVQANYLNLIASYMDAANQLNLAPGREVIQ